MNFELLLFALIILIYALYFWLILRAAAKMAADPPWSPVATPPPQTDPPQSADKGYSERQDELVRKDEP